MGYLFILIIIFYVLLFFILITYYSVKNNPSLYPAKHKNKDDKLKTKKRTNNTTK